MQCLGAAGPVQVMREADMTRVSVFAALRRWVQRRVTRGDGDAGATRTFFPVAGRDAGRPAAPALPPLPTDFRPGAPDGSEAQVGAWLRERLDGGAGGGAR